MPETLAPDVANYLAKEKLIAEEKKPIKEKLPLPSIESLPPELLKIAENVADISGTWNPVEIYTADSASIETERQKVFDSFDKGKEYNPSLTYSYANSLDLTASREKLIEQLQRLRTFGTQDSEGKKIKGGIQMLDRSTRLFRTALYFKIKDDLATCDLVDGIKTKDEEKIALSLKRKYPGSDTSLLNLAVEEFVKLTFEGDVEDQEGKGKLSKEETEFLKEKQFDAEGIRNAFEWSLRNYGMLYSSDNPQGFKVKVDKEATSIDVRDKSADGPTIFIPAGRRMNAVTLLGLIAHEIEGHARQSINGEKLFKLGGGRLKIDNEQLYEGLGLRYEIMIKKKLFGTETAAPRPFYVFGVRRAEAGDSFYQIFSNQVDMRLRIALKKQLGQELPPLSELDPKVLDKAKKDAWLTTYRVMRGHTDMSNKKAFAMAKDLGYLRGYQMDQQLLRNDLGFLNEEGIIASGALALLAELKLTPDKMPIPFKDAAIKYWEEVLKPQMERG